MTRLDVPDSPKSIRETLCLAQAAIADRPMDEHRKMSDILLLGRLIDECDRHRPLGPDGKHDDQHAPTCGCPDAPRLSEPLSIVVPTGTPDTLWYTRGDTVTQIGAPDWADGLDDRDKAVLRALCEYVQRQLTEPAANPDRTETT